MTPLTVEFLMPSPPAIVWADSALDGLVGQTVRFDWKPDVGTPRVRPATIVDARRHDDGVMLTLRLDDEQDHVHVSSIDADGYEVCAICGVDRGTDESSAT